MTPSTLHLGLHEDDKEQGLVYSLVDTKGFGASDRKDGALREKHRHGATHWSQALGHLLVGALFKVF